MEELEVLLGCSRERAKEIVNSVGGLHRLRTSPLDLLLLGSSASRDQAATIVAALRFGSAVMSARVPPTILGTPRLVAEVVGHLGLLATEELWVLTVTADLRLIQTHQVAKGGAHFVAADMPSILFPVLLDRAAGFFLAHNHPAGDPTPSELDRGFTEAVAAAACIVGFRFHDHIVIGAGAWAAVCSGMSGSLIKERPS